MISDLQYHMGSSNERPLERKALIVLPGESEFSPVVFELEARGFYTIIFEDHVDALNHLEENTVSLVIMDPVSHDIVSDGLNKLIDKGAGLDILRRAKEINAKSIVLMTPGLKQHYEIPSIRALANELVAGDAETIADAAERILSKVQTK